jgi:hypothetical protein
MRKSAHVLLLVVLGVLSTAALTVITALMSAVSLAATALIVPGTGTSNANVVPNYMEHARSRYLAPFTVCTSAADCALLGINYDASFWPIPIGNWCPGLSCATWNESVGTGVTGLTTALATLPEDAEPFVVFGYSQGGAVVSDTLREIRNKPALLDRVDSVVVIGNAYNPDGGFFTRFGFLPTIPIWNVTFGPPTPVDTGVPMTGIGFEYDPVMYAPLYLGNPLAFLNALAAFDTVHGYYLTPNGNGPTDPIAYGYTDQELAEILATDCPGAHCRVDSFGNEYYMIPAKSLPIFDLIMDSVPGPAKPFVQPVVNFLTPIAEVIINLGYDWSGDPGVARVASFLPFNPVQNWVQVGLDLVEAVGEGAQLAFSGTTTPLDPDSPVAPATVTQPSQDGGAGTVAEPADPVPSSTAATTSTATTLSTLSQAVDNTAKEAVSSSGTRTSFTPSARAEDRVAAPGEPFAKPARKSTKAERPTSLRANTDDSAQNAGGKGAVGEADTSDTGNKKDADSAPAAA